MRHSSADINLSPEEAEEKPAPECLALTIDELAAKTGVPSRTIRFYQAKGALPPPVKRGRIAYYNDRHIERLNLVARLQDRGISLRAIRELLDRVQVGSDSVNDWLGVGDQLRSSWMDDEPKVLTEEQLREALGAALRPGLIGELERAEFIRRDLSKKPSAYIVPSWPELQLILKLEAGGVDIRTSRVAADLMRASLSKLAYKLVSFFHEYLLKGIERKQLDPEHLGRSIETLRAIWMEATNLILAREIETVIREKTEKGDILWPGRRR
jgi:DNA-binding transcriptional MerR regulator